MSNSIAFNPELPVITESNRLWHRAEGLIPAGTQTLAKGPTQFSKGVAPKYLRRGVGARVWDVDGHEYLDYAMGVGPVILGYCHPVVDDAIRRQLEDGITFSLMHPLEVELAERLRECIPNTESVRFSKTGCDVTSAAVRLARAYTGRERVLCCGYHGWHDWYIAITDRNAGIPAGVQALTHTFQYNDIDSVLDAIDQGTACVILEPFVFERENGNFLAALRRVCDRFGTLLENEVFFFTTFGGEALSLAASIACIDFIRAHRVAERIAAVGQRLFDGLQTLIDELELDYLSLAGYPFRTILNFSPAAADPLLMKTLVQQELIRRGILWSGTHNLSYSHSEEDVDYTLQAYREALAVLKEAVAAGDVAGHLCGEPLQPVFRKTSQKPRSAPEAITEAAIPGVREVA